MGSCLDRGCSYENAAATRLKQEMGSSGCESYQLMGLEQKEHSGEMLLFLSFSIGIFQQEAVTR